MTVSFESRTVIGAAVALVFDLSLDIDAPLGCIGLLVERIVLENHLRKLIEERGAFLKRLAEQRS